MKLRALWQAVLNRREVDDEDDHRKYYEALSAFKIVVDSNTKVLNKLDEDHESIKDQIAHIDEQTRRLNEIFEDLSKTDDV